MKNYLYILLLFTYSVMAQNKYFTSNTANQTNSITVLRGPYLQLGTSSSMIVKWRTDSPCDTKIWYGLSTNSLTSQTSNTTLVTNHEIKITNLSPSTIYYYQIGNSTGILTNTSSNQYFKTSPTTGKTGKYKFWAIGDAGDIGNNQLIARNAFLNYTNNSPIDGWIWLGDNAYDGGFDSEYQANVFSNNTYENELKRIVVWPSPGNHDYNNSIPFSPPPAYLDIFTLPSAAEAGGVASGTEKYYSYDYGNVHFIVLDSYSVGRDATDPMGVWLQNDLAANTLPWIVAYWHHPPYTKGSHNSDNSTFIDWELEDMRENIIPILENGGVDLVLSGHSHCYERSFLIDGHYGTSNQLSQSMIKDNTSGYYPASCPYQKQTVINKAHKGTIYSVVGCSAKFGGTSSGWPHPIFYSYTNAYSGSMLIEVNDNRLDAKFITGNNTIYDGFSIVKNAGKKTTQTICQGQSAILKPSWPEAVNWFPQGTIQDSVVVNPLFSTIYIAYDSSFCIKDTFIVNVIPNNSAPCNITGVGSVDSEKEVSIYPTTLKNKNESITIKVFSGQTIQQIKANDSEGKAVELIINERSVGELKVNFKNEPSDGIYFLELIVNNKQIHKKIIFNK